MSWHKLDSLAGLAAVLTASQQRPQLLFKHSTRCSISSVALARLEAGLPALAAKVDAHYLDLLAYRDVSNAVATQLAVQHESPQALLVLQGECTAEWSHLEISVAEILAALPQPA